MKLTKFCFLLLVLCNTLLFTQVSELNEIPITLPDVWKIENKSIQVEGTIVTGGVLLAVHVIVDKQPQENDEYRLFAKKIAKYAVLNGYLENALKYNKYDSKTFFIKEKIIGVALIYVDADDQMSAVKFVFETKELVSKNEEIKSIPIPKTFTKNEKNILKEKLKKIVKSRNFDKLYDLYAKDALDDFDVEEDKKTTIFYWNLSKSTELLENDFIIYFGKKSKVNGYYYYIPIEAISSNNVDEKLRLFIKILIIDNPDKYGIYNIELNFPNLEVFKKYSGDIEEIESSEPK